MKNYLKFIFAFALVAQCADLVSYEMHDSSKEIILNCDGCRGGK